MNDGVSRLLIVCGAIEALAWALAWYFDWSLVTVLVAVVTSCAIAGVILVVQRRKRAD